MALSLLRFIDMQCLTKDILLHKEIKPLRIEISFDCIAPLLVQNLKFLTQNMHLGTSRKSFLKERPQPRHLGTVLALPPFQSLDLRLQFLLPTGSCCLFLFQEKCAALQHSANLCK